MDPAFPAAMTLKIVPMICPSATRTGSVLLEMQVAVVAVSMAEQMAAAAQAAQAAQAVIQGAEMGQVPASEMPIAPPMIAPTAPHHVFVETLVAEARVCRPVKLTANAQTACRTVKGGFVPPLPVEVTEGSEMDQVPAKAAVTVRPQIVPNGQPIASATQTRASACRDALLTANVVLQPVT